MVAFNYMDPDMAKKRYLQLLVVIQEIHFQIKNVCPLSRQVYFADCAVGILSSVIEDMGAACNAGC